MIYILKMPEIFNGAGPELDSYLKNNKSKSDVLTDEDASSEVANLFKKASFTFSDTDISDISDSSLKSEPGQYQEYTVISPGQNQEYIN